MKYCNWEFPLNYKSCTDNVNIYTLCDFQSTGESIIYLQYIQRKRNRKTYNWDTTMQSLVTGTCFNVK